MKVWEINVYVLGVAKRCRKESNDHFKIAELPYGEKIDLEAFKAQAVAVAKTKMKSLRKLQIIAFPVNVEDIGGGVIIRSMAVSSNNPRLNIELEAAEA